ncbi:MAG: type IV toxin-antitoxin system AbiEi family antitoxin domain-containing protein [Thermoplasmatota archaeon]
MNDLEIHRKLSDLETPVFSVSQLKAMLDLDYNGTVVKLNHLVRKDVLLRVMGGVYSLPDTDPLCISSFIENPSYVSLWAALRYHDMTTQTPRIIDVINIKRSKTITVGHSDGSFDIRFIKTGADRMFGYSKGSIGGHSCFIADPEKSIIDCLLYLSYIPIDEVIEAINEQMNMEKLIKYSKMIGRQSLYKRIGFILEENGFDIEPGIFGDLSDNYVRLDPSGDRKGTYNRKWHIIQNGVRP